MGAPERLTNRQMVEIQVPSNDGKLASGPVHKAIQLIPACDVEFRCGNIRASMARGLPEISQEDFHSRLAVVVGFGHSLHDTWQEIPGTREPHDVFTVSGAHSFLVERGVRVYGHSECDPREHKHKLLYLTDPNTRFFIASRCHPTMFDHLLGLGRDVRIIHTGRGEEEAQTVRAINPRAEIISPASMIGLQTVMTCFWLGYRKFRFYGLDCSFPKDAPSQHAGEHPHKGDPLPVEINGRTFWTTMSMICSFTDFFNIAIQHPMGTFDLRGDGMLQWGEKVSRGAV
jgi:hypothetical protein